jgi:hypothetical protein
LVTVLSQPLRQLSQNYDKIEVIRQILSDDVMNVLLLASRAVAFLGGNATS